jgi:hypothetical protein
MTEQQGKLEQGLLQAMKAIDNQVARAMQRSPAEREIHGVQKWEPYASRVEYLTAFILEELGANDVSLDSVLVLVQAFAKALHFAVDDLGPEGLGAVRSSYCLDAMEKVQRDAQVVVEQLRERHLT